MQITLNQLTFQTIIGILPEERITPQEVVLNLKITYTYTSNEFINYADVASFLEITMQHEKYLLIEDALHDLCEKLLTKFPLIEKMSLQILKPTILKNAIVGVKHKVKRNKN